MTDQFLKNVKDLISFVCLSMLNMHHKSIPFVQTAKVTSVPRKWLILPREQTFTVLQCWFPCIFFRISVTSEDNRLTTGVSHGHLVSAVKHLEMLT